MKSYKEFPRIYLYRPYADMRKQSRGLSLMVQMAMDKDPFSDALFLFCNKSRNIVKALYWDKTGFAMWVKNLEEERFKWPKKLEQEVISLSKREIAWLLDGIDFTKVKPHKKLSYKEIG